MLREKLRAWLIGEDLKRIETTLQALTQEIDGLKEDLKKKADKGELENVRLKLDEVIKSVDGLILEIEKLGVSLRRDQLLQDEFSRKELVIRLIREGYNTPQRLKEIVPFGNKKLYEVLRELEQEGLIEKIKKNRKVYYIIKTET